MASRIVTLRNSRGEKIHCILEEPPGRSTAPVAALLLCPGVKTRVGPHRLYRKLLRPFLARGIPVMRVDFAGLGDSEGEWADDGVEAIYRSIELGHCTEEVRCAFDWLEANLGLRRFIAGGLCGAASTALHLASEDERLVALYAIGLPPTLPAAEGEEPLGAAQLRAQRLTYVRKLMNLRSWLRFFSFRSDYRRIVRLAARTLLTKKAASPRPDARAAIPAPASDFNPHLLAAVRGMLAGGRPALLIYGESDPLRARFQDQLTQPSWAALEQYKSLFTYAVIPAANHILGEPGAVDEANRLTAVWLDAILSASKSASPVFGPHRGAQPRAAQA